MTNPEAPNSTSYPEALETEDGLVLRQLSFDDGLAYFDLIDFDRGHLSQFGDDTADKYPTVNSVRNSITSPNKPERVRYGIWDNILGKDVMVARISIEPEGEETAEVGYLVGKRYVGYRYAARALKVLCDYTFDNNKFKTLFAQIAVGNEASRKTVVSCGFNATEVIRKTDPKGELRDYWIYTLQGQTAGSEGTTQ